MASKKTARKPRLGSGKRFAKLKGQLARKGVRDPAALAATIGRRQLGAKKFNRLATQGRKRAAARRRGGRHR
jgi:hypothetical protein